MAEWFFKPLVCKDLTMPLEACCTESQATNPVHVPPNPELLNNSDGKASEDDQILRWFDISMDRYRYMDIWELWERIATVAVGHFPLFELCGTFEFIWQFSSSGKKKKQKHFHCLWGLAIQTCRVSICWRIGNVNWSWHSFPGLPFRTTFYYNSVVFDKKQKWPIARKPAVAGLSLVRKIDLNPIKTYYYWLPRAAEAVAWEMNFTRISIWPTL